MMKLYPFSNRVKKNKIIDLHYNGAGVSNDL